jgi:hypothetical protein
LFGLVFSVRISDRRLVLDKNENVSFDTRIVATEQESITLLRAILERLTRLEKQVSVSTAKENYTVEEAAERLGRAKWTVRQWCNLGQARANRIRGSGRKGEWRIAHDELGRLHNEGPSPPGTFQNQKVNRIAS